MTRIIGAFRLRRLTMALETPFYLSLYLYSLFLAVEQNARGETLASSDTDYHYSLLKNHMATHGTISMRY